MSIYQPDIPGFHGQRLPPYDASTLKIDTHGYKQYP